MRQCFVVALVVVLCMTGSSTAFDGQRKGFVLGGGLGFSPEATYSVGLDLGPFGTLTVDENGSGFGLNLVIGGAFNEQNMLVYEGNVAGWKSDILNDNISQGFNGAAWYHYFGPLGKSAFTVAGIGAYVFQAENYEDNDPGLGILLGGGYEFSKHWQIGGYYSFGKTSDSGVDFDHHHLNILVSGIAF